MSLWHPDPPQGFSKSQGQVIIGRPMIPLIGAPQGVGVSPPVTEDPLLTIFPPLADNTYQFYKFYQIKKNQSAGVHTNLPLVIIDTLGPGILQEASGFDIKVFDGQTDLEIPYEREFVDTVTGDFIIHLKLGTVKDLNFVQIVFGKPTATDISTTILDSEYDISYRMNQTTFGANSTKDSSPNGRDGTPNGTITSITGQIGLGLNGNGANDSRILTGSALALGSEFTISFWCNPNALAPNDNFCGAFVSFPGIPGWILGTPISGDLTKLQFAPQGSATGASLFTNSSIMIGVWQKFTLVLEGGILTLYQDGDFIDSDTLGIAIINTSDFGVFGLPITGTTQINSMIDQFSIQNVAITADEVKTRYNNESNNSAFWFGTPILENGEDNFLVDDMGRKIVVVQT